MADRACESGLGKEKPLETIVAVRRQLLCR